MLKTILLAPLIAWFVIAGRNEFDLKTAIIILGASVLGAACTISIAGLWGVNFSDFISFNYSKTTLLILHVANIVWLTSGLFVFAYAIANKKW